jgi:hypothetical protein
MFDILETKIPLRPAGLVDSFDAFVSYKDSDTLPLLSHMDMCC